MVIGQNGSASLVEYGGKKDSKLLIQKNSQEFAICTILQNCKI